LTLCTDSWRRRVRPLLLWERLKKVAGVVAVNDEARWSPRWRK
jgi:hypothetical protein